MLAQGVGLGILQAMCGKLGCGFEWSAELRMPAPSQTGGLRCTIGSGRRLAKSLMLWRLTPLRKQKGAINAVSCVARLDGYSAVGELT